MGNGCSEQVYRVFHFAAAVYIYEQAGIVITIFSLSYTSDVYFFFFIVNPRKSATTAINLQSCERPTFIIALAREVDILGTHVHTYMYVYARLRASRCARIECKERRYRFWWWFAVSAQGMGRRWGCGGFGKRGRERDGR